MPRRKVNENGSTAATSGGTKPRSRRIKKDAQAGAMEQKLDMVQMYDAQAPPSVQSMPMMHNHNGMMGMHDDGGGGPMSSHNLYSSPVAGMPGGPPPPEYYQPMPGPPPGSQGYSSAVAAAAAVGVGSGGAGGGGGSMMPPPGPHNGAASNNGGNNGSGQPGQPGQVPQQHQFMEPDPPQSPYINQPPHMQQHNHMMIRYRNMPAMGPSTHHQGLPPSQLEFKLNEMNRRLFIFSNSGIQDKDHAQWWDAFAHEFFDDDARMSFTIFDEQNPGRSHRYAVFSAIGRMLIPRYFRTIFESGVKEMYYVLRSVARESTGGFMVYCECENLLIVTKHEKPFSSEVQTECKLMCEFIYDETCGHRIRQWNIEMRQCQEYVLRDPNMVRMLSVCYAFLILFRLKLIFLLVLHDSFVPRLLSIPLSLQLQDSETQEKMKNSITITGMTSITLNYLKLCAILEPMQILMSQSKIHNLSPKESLKQTLFEYHSKYQQMQRQQQHQQQMAMNAMRCKFAGAMNPPHQMPPTPVEEPSAKKPRKRTRKAAGATGAQGTGSKKKNTSSPAPSAANFQGSSHYPVPYQDVMVVGEPSMMGGDYGEEDERTISRVENTQYDPNAMQNQMGAMSQPMNPSITSLGGPPNQSN
uniref:LID domain-containing protein n=1 Tax=Syphacia muris TaxID=451379 RepID=A0A0N5AT24_9BILA